MLVEREVESDQSGQCHEGNCSQNRVPGSEDQSENAEPGQGGAEAGGPSEAQIRPGSPASEDQSGPRDANRFILETAVVGGVFLGVGFVATN